MPPSIPKDLQDKFIDVAALFVAKTGADVRDVQEFMVQIIRIHNECLHREARKVIN